MYINESLLSYYWYESFAYSEYTALKNTPNTGKDFFNPI